MNKHSRQQLVSFSPLARAPRTHLLVSAQLQLQSVVPDVTIPAGLVGASKMGVLPYTTATGNVEKALLGIKAAATPEKVTQDFVKTILKIPGGSGDQMTALLKKLGFVNTDGTPSNIYKKFRNNSSTGTAAADALRTGYAALFKRNEFWPALEDSELRGLIIEETGQDADSNVVTMTLNTIKGVKKFANFDRTNEVTPVPPGETQAPLAPNFALPSPPSVGLNLGYTINLNLPATSDIAVFNAIFKSLKENLLKSSDENG